MVARPSRVVLGFRGAYAGTVDTMVWSSIDDAELERQALDADPDVALDDAVPLATLLDDASGDALPSWYMPTPMSSGRRIRGWRRHAIVLVVASFLAIDAYGLCNTYGDLSPQTVQVRTHNGR